MKPKQIFAIFFAWLALASCAAVKKQKVIQIPAPGFHNYKEAQKVSCDYLVEKGSEKRKWILIVWVQYPKRSVRLLRMVYFRKPQRKEVNQQCRLWTKLVQLKHRKAHMTVSLRELQKE